MIGVFLYKFAYKFSKFEYVKYENLSEETLSAFIEKYNIELSN